MKNRLTKLSIFLSLIIGMLFASCGSGTPEMHTVEGVQRVVDVYTKYIDTDKYKPISIRYTEKGKLTNELGYMTFTMIGKADNKNHNQTINIEGGKEVVEDIVAPDASDIYSRFSHLNPNKKEKNFDTEPWIQASEIKPELIAKLMETSFTQIEEGYTIESVAYCNISREDKTGEIIYTFGLNVVKDGSTQYRGKHIVTEYTTVNFRGHTDGKVEKLN